MIPLLVISNTSALPWSGVCRGSGGSGTGRTAGSSGVAVYWQGPLVTPGVGVAVAAPPASSIPLANMAVAMAMRRGLLDTTQQSMALPDPAADSAFPNQIPSTTCSTPSPTG